MATLSSMLTSVVEVADPVSRAGLEQFLEEFGHVNTDVVGYEVANKSMPEIRKRAAGNTPSVLTKGGRERASEESTLVISLGQLATVLGRMVRNLQKDARERRPADAILGEMVAIEGAGRSIRAGLRAREETVGGHIRF